MSFLGVMEGMGQGHFTGPNTIGGSNPAVLNTLADYLPTSSSINASVTHLGRKRGRSLEYSEDTLKGETGDDVQKPKRYGTFPQRKEKPTTTKQQASFKSPDHLRTPQLQPQSLPQKSTNTKSAVVRALPTVRGHTTDQLTAEQDEYLPREYDEAGEQKVSPMGEPLGGRQFQIRTFCVVNRGTKRFMLAIECARLLGYRDSYMLFKKNRSLYKINVTQEEKDALIHQAILPSSAQSRPITIVTVKAIFRQFGARVIQDGRRVQDDYWEARAKKQGFTEKDTVNDKRPGATKAKEASADLEASNNPIVQLGFGQEQDEIYPPSLAKVEDARQQPYERIPILEQETTETPHVDHTQTASAAYFMHHPQYAAHLNNEHARKAEALTNYIGLTWDMVLKKAVPWPQQKAEQDPSIAQKSVLSSSLPEMKGYQQSMSGTQMMCSEATFLPQPPIYQHNPPTQPPSRSTRPDLRHRQPDLISYPPSQHAPLYHAQPSQISGHPPPQPWQSLSSIPEHQHVPFLPSRFQHTSQPDLGLSSECKPRHRLQYTVADMPTGSAGCNIRTV